MVWKILMALGFLLTINKGSMIFHSHEVVQPDYAQWGRLAVKETQSKYPDAKVIDYLHQGSETKGDSTIEKFKLWLKDGEKEFGVFVRIEYNTKTKQVIHIGYQETSR